MEITRSTGQIFPSCFGHVAVTSLLAFLKSLPRFRPLTLQVSANIILSAEPETILFKCVFQLINFRSMSADQVGWPYVHVDIGVHLGSRSVKNPESVRKLGIDESSVCRCAIGLFRRIR